MALGVEDRIVVGMNLNADQFKRELQTAQKRTGALSKSFGALQVAAGNLISQGIRFC